MAMRRQVSARRASVLSRAEKVTVVVPGAASRQTAESTEACALPFTDGAAEKAAG